MKLSLIIEILIYLALIVIVIYISTTNYQNLNQIGGKKKTNNKTICFGKTNDELGKGGIWRSCFKNHCFSQDNINKNFNFCDRVIKRLIKAVNDPTNKITMYYG